MDAVEPDQASEIGLGCVLTSPKMIVRAEVAFARPDLSLGTSTRVGRHTEYVMPNGSTKCEVISRQGATAENRSFEVLDFIQTPTKGRKLAGCTDVEQLMATALDLARLP